ncbi:hypothetical protein [Herbaspirillum sp. ST 5-3]|uniref:hypothetical protein n=1 Tax=Oxalobacteraceae TaxID=75682 RepID=UPI0014560535|nr:hypothetical protein [Herbaspirillum sp. ST 5-3]
MNHNETACPHSTSGETRDGERERTGKQNEQAEKRGAMHGLRSVFPGSLLAAAC